MVVLFNARISNRPRLVNPGTQTPTAIPDRLVSVDLIQPGPIGGDSFGGSFVGWFDPEGGIGPYTYVISGAPSAKYVVTNDVLGTKQGAVDTTTIDTMTVTCTDGRKDVVTKVFTVDKAIVGINGVSMNSKNPVTNNCPVDPDGRIRYDKAPIFAVNTYGPNHLDNRPEVTSITNQDGTPSTQWYRGPYGISFVGGIPTPGSYPVTMSRGAPGGDVQDIDVTLVITPILPITYIEFVPAAGVLGILSTATLPGTTIGYLAATTPSNAPIFSGLDSTGTFSVAPVTGEVVLVKRPTSPGVMTFLASVVDGRASLTGYPIVLTVQPGNIISPTNMTLNASTTLDNSRPNQVIGPVSITPGSVPGPQYWVITDQTGFNEIATTTQYGTPARYQLPPTGGTLTSNGLLSYQDPVRGYIPDEVTISCTDGINTCTRTFIIDVKEAPTTHWFIGRGTNPIPSVAWPGVNMTNIASGTDMPGATPFAQYHNANLKCIGYHPGVKHVFWIYDRDASDLDAYTNGTMGADTKLGWTGPVDIVGVGPNGPRLGGQADNTGIHTGTSDQGKGHLLFVHGDGALINCRVSGVHGASSNDGREAIRKDGQTAGNFYMYSCHIYDNDQGIESGVEHGYITVDKCLFQQNGGAIQGGGLCHNLYIGGVSRLRMTNSVTMGVNWGHLFKCRAMNSYVDNNVFWDTIAGASEAEFSNFGDVTFTNNFMIQGPSSSSGFCLNVGGEGAATYIPVNKVVANNNTFVLGLSYAANYGPVTAIAHYHLISTQTGADSIITGTGNKVWLPPMGQLTADNIGQASYPNPPPGSTTVTNWTMLALPPLYNVVDPRNGGPLPVMGKPYRHRIFNDPPTEFINFAGTYQKPDRLQFRVAATAPVGTVICVLTPMGDIDANRVNGDPFGPGNTTALVTTRMYNTGNLNPWAAAGQFNVTANFNGTVTVSKGTVNTSGVYYLQVETTAPDGVTKNTTRLMVVVT